MVSIHRIVEGKDYYFVLSQDELDYIYNQDKIQWAKDILANYVDDIVDYDNIISDKGKLLEFANLLEDKTLSDNGHYEIEAIEELFEIKEWDDE